MRDRDVEVTTFGDAARGNCRFVGPDGLEYTAPASGHAWDPHARYFACLAGAGVACQSARDAREQPMRERHIRLAIDNLTAALALLPELVPPPPAPALGPLDDETC